MSWNRRSVPTAVMASGVILILSAGWLWWRDVNESRGVTVAAEGLSTLQPELDVAQTVSFVVRNDTDQVVKLINASEFG